MDKATNKEVDRYIYINNVPLGSIPFISSGLGVNFSQFRGLIPGTMSNLNVLNPFTIMQAFMSGATPDCQEITLETIDSMSNSSNETHFVSVVDLQNMDACTFSDKKNPITGKGCSETFSNMSGFGQGVAKNADLVTLPDDPIVQIYYASLGLLAIYVLYCLMNNRR